MASFAESAKYAGTAEFGCLGNCSSSPNATRTTSSVFLNEKLVSRQRFVSSTKKAAVFGD